MSLKKMTAFLLPVILAAAMSLPVLASSSSPESSDTGEASSYEQETGKKMDKEASVSYLKEMMESRLPHISLSCCTLEMTEIEELLKEIREEDPVYSFFPYHLSYSSSSRGGVETYHLQELTNSAFEDEGIAEKVRSYDRACKEIASAADPSWSDLEKVLYIHDWLCVHNTAVSHPSSDPRHNDEHNGIGAVLEGNSVCQGFAMAFIKIAKDMGIDAVTVSNYDVNHMWVLVKVDGRWYHMDILEDKEWLGAARAGTVSHTRFLKSGEYIQSKNLVMDAETGEIRQADYCYYVDGVKYTSANDLASDTGYDSMDPRGKDTVWYTENAPFSYYDGSWYCAGTRNGWEAQTEQALRYHMEGNKLVCDGRAFPDGVWEDSYRGLYINSGYAYTKDGDTLVRINMKTFEKEKAAQGFMEDTVSWYMDRDGSLYSQDSSYRALSSDREELKKAFGDQEVPAEGREEEEEKEDERDVSREEEDSLLNEEEKEKTQEEDSSDEEIYIEIYEENILFAPPPLFYEDMFKTE